MDVDQRGEYSHSRVCQLVLSPKEWMKTTPLNAQWSDIECPLPSPCMFLHKGKYLLSTADSAHTIHFKWRIPRGISISYYHICKEENTRPCLYCPTSALCRQTQATTKPQSQVQCVQGILHDMFSCDVQKTCGRTGIKDLSSVFKSETNCYGSLNPSPEITDLRIGGVSE